MKIVFWGTPQYAAENLINIVKARFDVVGVITQPDRKRGRGKILSPSPVKQAAIELTIPVFTTPSISNDKITRNLIRNLNADVYIVVAFGQILPKEILDQPKLGCWNSHASLLPLWRGAAPIQWSIINDDKKTGICIMSMEEGLDTGPVIEQEITTIRDTDNLETLKNRLSKISSKLLIKALQNIENTMGLTMTERLEVLKAIDQSKINRNISYARQIKKEDYLIDWNSYSREIIKKILGLYPNAYTLYNGKRIKITEATLIDDNCSTIYKDIINELKKEKISPGQIITNQSKLLIIMTRDLPILIKYGQLQGKTKTDGYTLYKQSKLRINDIFGT